LPTTAEPQDESTLTSQKRRTIFAAMPFAPEYDDVFFVAMAFAAEQVNAVCRRVDQDNFSGDIVSRIEELIRASDAVIADISESKPNVLYETGFAHGVGRPRVHICCTELENMPFDVRNWNTLRYTRGRTCQLREPLAQRLATIFGTRP
jgi:hypothetical protein